MSIVDFWVSLVSPHRKQDRTKSIQDLNFRQCSFDRALSTCLPEVSERQGWLKSMENRATEDLEPRAGDHRAGRGEAERVSQANNDLLATVSHEIRTPVNGLLGMVALMMDTSLTREQQDYMNSIRDSAEYLVTIVNDVLDFAKIEAGKLRIESVEMNVRVLVAQVLESVSVLACRRGLTLETEIDEKVPLTLCGDPMRLRQVLLNFLSNAVKFTERGSVKVSVSFEGGKQNGTKLPVCFAVTDTGIGIPIDVQGRLFQSFSQADASTARKYGGTGLGLSISKQLVDLMGGSIGMSSDGSNGSRFWFTVDLENGRSQSPTSSSVGGDAGEACAGQSRLLVVEDNLINQKVAVQLLTRLGFAVNVASNGSEAVAAFQSHRFDAILMDCQMPVMDGFEATVAIRKTEILPQHTPIIAVTANTVPGQREKCLAAGMDDFVGKPVTRQVLEKTLARWVRKPEPAALLAS
jgi:signal transduction histidine kinase/CheY-like chemotaxis protein